MSRVRASSPAPEDIMSYKISLVQTADIISGNAMVPLAVGILWSYAIAHNPDISDKFELIDVLYRKDNIPEQAEQLSQVDIVCFSCYLWNLQYQLALMKAVKQINPNVYIVVGGPAIVSTDPGFWLLHKKYVDLAIEGEAEESFVKVLKDFPLIDTTTIPGSFGPTFTAGLPERRKVFLLEDSPYINGFFDKTLLDINNRGEFPQAVIQTNRGCPYHCGFCEEGVDYKNKIYQYDYDRVEQEFLWCAKNGIYGINLADDNFGILERDVGILQYAIDLKLKYGFPKVVYFTFTKNNPDRVALMSQMMLEQKADFFKSATIGLQSLNPEVLKAIKRFNLDEEKHKKLIDRLNDIGMSTYVELIWPLPYETYDSFCEGIDKLSKRKLTNWVNVYSFGIPPGTDIGRDFVKELKTAETLLPSTTKFDGRIQEQVYHVYETAWATHDDVVRGQVFTMWLAVLYFFGYGQYFIDQLIEQKGTTLSTVLNRFLNYAIDNNNTLISQWNSIITDQWSKRLRGLELTDVSIFPGEDTTHWYYFTHLASWVNNNRQEFYKELKAFAVAEQLENADFIFEVLPDFVMSMDKQYPYTRTVNGVTVEVSHHPMFLSFDETHFNNNYEFSRFYYFWKRQGAWHKAHVKFDNKVVSLYN